MHRDVRVFVRLGGAGEGRRSDAERVAVAPGEPADGVLFGVRLGPASQRSCLYAGFGTGLWTELLGRLSLLFGVSGGRRRGCPTSEDVQPSRTVTPTPASKIRVSERGSSAGYIPGADRASVLGVSMMTPGRGAAVRQALAVDVHLHGRRFIVVEFTAFAVLFAGWTTNCVVALR